jgi:hypothetical protein
VKLHRLRVRSFAAVRELDVAFGPGLNVLYGPNDLGKSTLADAIRLALLLPHASSGCKPYVPWSGGDEPYVELTFETEAQRIWRVRKQFGTRGSSYLEESRNGQDYNEVERARRVDARLREILRWGIPEPGGSGSGKGIPTSFLATALLSTQADVADVLRSGLHEDGTTSGKDQIAAALEAVAQDPLFVEMLRQTQARRDEAYTDRGAKKTARGSVFKVAADRVKEAREEVEKLQKVVDDSEGVERQLGDLYQQRDRTNEELASAEERMAAVQLLAQQVVDRAKAWERVEAARAEVLRIQGLDQAVVEAEQRVRDLAVARERADQKLKESQEAEASARKALEDAEETAGALGSDMADTVARQDLELRKIAADQEVQVARHRVDTAVRARGLVEAATHVEEEHRSQETTTVQAREKMAEAIEAEQVANDALGRCDLLERGAEARNAERQVASARAGVERESALQAELSRISADRSDLAEQRASIVVPPTTSLPALRRLETELVSARGALDVGLVMTVIPTAMVNVRVRKDGIAADSGLIAQPLEVEADAEVEVDIADLATVRVRGGRREAQERVRALESRREAEILPHLTAAGVADLEALDARMAEAKDLDSRIQSLEGDLESLRRQTAELAGAAEELREATVRAAACHVELGDETLETLAAALDLLGPDPVASLRSRRQQATREAARARADVQKLATEQALAEQRVQSLRERLDKAVADRDQALAEFPDGMAAGAAAAEEMRRVTLQEQERVAAELASLKGRMDARRGEIDSALAQARGAVEEARLGVETAQKALAKAIAEHGNEEGKLIERRKRREAEDLPAAERRLQEAMGSHDALPVPERSVTAEEVTGVTETALKARQCLSSLNEEILTTQGKLQQVGGAVARDRLHDAEEALELADYQDRELEMDYEAWKLLLEQMKAADADQASNLGQVLAPALAGRFQILTQQRYQNLHLTAHLSTEGVFVAGAVRSPDRMSVGTREQLSTLYRLCLGEYLQTTIVLDDQLVQSDDTRMEWFRALLAEKARSFQIVVFTCRPSDYLAREAMAAGDGVVYTDSDEGFVRAIDLGRAVGLKLNHL